MAQIGAAIGREFSHALLVAVARRPETTLRSALDRLVTAGLLFRQGVLPHATYLFKHALVQDAAYGTLLREQRRALHARIAETIEGQFTEITESQPELLARHCTEAGQIEKAAGQWGKAGQRSLERSALVEAAEQFARALAQMETLSSTPAQRRQKIKLQVRLINPLLHVKGYAAPETKAAAERAGELIEQAEALSDAPEDPLLLFEALYGSWAANFLAFNSDAILELAPAFLALAEKQKEAIAQVVGHRLMGAALMSTGNIAGGRAHFDRGLALYDPVRHRPLLTRFGVEVGIAILSWRPFASWMLGYPEAALADIEKALGEAREIGHGATLMYVLTFIPLTLIQCGNYAAAKPLVHEAIAFAEEKGALNWKAYGIMTRGVLTVLTGKTSDAVSMIADGIAAWRSLGAKLFTPLYLSYLSKAYAESGQFGDAWRCIGEAINAAEITKESWWASDTHRIAGEIVLKSPEPDAAKAEAYFDRALAVARQQQAKSWELRAANSLARLWRDQGKVQQARELLAPWTNFYLCA
jgi:predicted ATPase